MTARERAFVGRAAALAILLAVLVAIWVGPVAAYLGALAAGDARIAAKTALLQRYRTLAEAGTTAAPAPSGEALLFPDMPETQAAALLQETIKAAAAAARVEVRGMQVMHPQMPAGAAAIGLRVSAAGDIAGLARLLYAIAAARPLLYPDNLQVRAAAAGQSQAPGRLEFQLDVSGVRAGGA